MPPLFVPVPDNRGAFIECGTPSQGDIAGNDRCGRGDLLSAGIGPVL